jgi:tRNA threonylcarbamoyladenosine biosynthesis protein TsaB
MMRTVALDTATKTASVAVLEEDRVIAEINIDLGVHHSQILLPAIDHICQLTGIKPSSIDLFACTIGPGSFTGLRIGAATIKGLALAQRRPVAGVSTLEALAMNAPPSSKVVCPMLDARKKQIYTALYRIQSDGFPDLVEHERVIEIELYLKMLEKRGEPFLFLGEGAVLNRMLIEKSMGKTASFVSFLHNHITASAVGLMGRHRFLRGELLDFITFVPRYLRPSEAETKVEANDSHRHVKLASAVDKKSQNLYKKR